MANKSNKTIETTTPVNAAGLSEEQILKMMKQEAKRKRTGK